jgi:hypothetical protein
MTIVDMWDHVGTRHYHQDRCLAIVSCVGAPDASLSSRAALETSPCIISPGDRDGGGGGGGTLVGAPIGESLGTQRVFLATQGSPNLKSSGIKLGMISHIISIQHVSRTYRADRDRQFLVRSFLGGGPTSSRLDGDAVIAEARITRTC